MLVAASLFLVGCTQKVSEIKDESHIGKTVTVSGMVTKSFKLGSISGYVLSDKTGEIGISASRLPAEGDAVTVTGVLIKDTIFGFYIKAEEN